MECACGTKSVLYRYKRKSFDMYEFNVHLLTKEKFCNVKLGLLINRFFCVFGSEHTLTNPLFARFNYGRDIFWY